MHKGAIIIDCEEMLQLEHLLCSAQCEGKERDKSVGMPYIHGVHVEVLLDFMNKDILELCWNH